MAGLPVDLVELRHSCEGLLSLPLLPDVTDDEPEAAAAGLEEAL
jgi:hypothetical protein